MTTNKRKRLDRLITIRDLEREIVKAESAEAAKVLENSNRCREKAANELQQEIDMLNVDLEKEVCRLFLASECVGAATEDLARAEIGRRDAAVRHKERLNRLFDAHRRVRQLELLASDMEAKDAQGERKREQKQMDDLASLKQGARA